MWVPKYWMATRLMSVLLLDNSRGDEEKVLSPRQLTDLTIKRMSEEYIIDVMRHVLGLRRQQ
jgi:hypothetical protein